jgi:hypothetical protein
MVALNPLCHHTPVLDLPVRNLPTRTILKLPVPARQLETTKLIENSELLPVASVAVAVT